MRGYRRLSGSTTSRAWRYAALGLGATLAVVFGFVADDRAGRPSVIAVGSGPMAIALTPDGEAAYVVDWSGGSVMPVNLAHGDTGGAIAFPVDVNTAGGRGAPGVIAIAIAPDGATAYVDDPFTGALLPISLASGTTGTPIRIAGDAGQIAITPDGATAYVVTYDSTVVPVSLATGTPGTPIPVGGAPEYIAITPDGATAYVTSTDNDTVVPVNLAAGTAGKPIPDPDVLTGAIAIAPDGTAYVANYYGGGQNGSVTPINLAAGTVGKPIPAGDAPQAIAIDPAGTAAYVTDFNSDSVDVLPLKH